MSPKSLPFSDEFRPRMRGGVLEFPVHHMRGGTSTGLVIWEHFAPQSQNLRDELLRHLMGVPLLGQNDKNRQITGLGRGGPTSNKVFFADIESTESGEILVSTLAQLANNHAEIDWSVNCGNMSSALQLWALDTEIMKTNSTGPLSISIRNTNTGVVSISRMHRHEDGSFTLASIPGVDGAFPAVDLFMQSPVGTKTGELLPTGVALEVIDAFSVSCVDVAVPMVICDAREFGKTVHEPIEDLEADAAFMKTLRSIWTEAGLRMKLRRRDGNLMTVEELERSETIPKICIIGAPQKGGHLSVRYFTPQKGHASMAVTGGCCLAAAALIPGSVAHRIVQGQLSVSEEYSDIQISIENPGGILDATVVCRINGKNLEVQSAAYRRNTQTLLRGHSPLYRASAELIAAYSL